MQTILQTVIDQLTATSPPRGARLGATRDLTFTKNFYSKAKACGLSEAYAKDVYYTGHYVKHKSNILVKSYNGYRVGIYYFQDTQTGKPVISSIWKQE